MICISIVPESRKLAKVDMFNAASQSDLIELCLDHLVKDPDVGEMIQDAKKPILISCRRECDGGHFKGTDEERIGLLRQAIVAGPEYIELEHDIAKSIPRFGKTKRVISFTSLDQPLSDIEKCFEEAKKVDADIIKFTWPTPTLNTTWPLIAAVSQKRDIPVVGMGLGKAGLTFSLLGRKYGSPWIYAALEKGMEAFEGQPSVRELNEVYDWSAISNRTRFIGIVGMSPLEQKSIPILNKAFQKMDLNFRCLPLQLGPLEKIPKMLEGLKIKGLLITPQLGPYYLDLADVHEDSVLKSGFTDMLLRKETGWKAYHFLAKSILNVIELSLGRRTHEERPLDRRSVMIIGANGTAKTMAYGVTQRKGIVSITSPNDEQSSILAEKFNARHVPFGNVYGTLADVIIYCDPAIKMGHHKKELNPSFLKEKMTVLDISSLPELSEFGEEAAGRDCKMIDSNEIFKRLLSDQFKKLTGERIPEELFEEFL